MVCHEISAVEAVLGPNVARSVPVCGSIKTG